MEMRKFWEGGFKCLPFGGNQLDLSHQVKVGDKECGSAGK